MRDVIYSLEIGVSFFAYVFVDSLPYIEWSFTNLEILISRITRSSFCKFIHYSFMIVHNGAIWNM